MRPGPRPMPTKLRIVRGETRPSRINPNEPQLPSDEPEMPETLSLLAQPVWRRTIERLRGSGVLTRADGDMLAVYCEHVVNHELMTQTIRDSLNAWLLQGRHGNLSELVKNPLVGMTHREALLLNRLADSFGLMPAARVGLVVPQEAASDLESLLS